MFLKNPFLILQLPANATSAEIRAAGQMARARLRLSDSQNTAAIREVEGAIEDLRDPVIRFTAGLYWVSLGSEAAQLLMSDPDFEKLSERPLREGGRAFDRLFRGEANHCRDHGQALCALVRAHAIMSSNGMFAEKSAGTKLLGLGLDAWLRATNSPEFWLAQRFRAREIGDPRVGTDLLKHCQDSAIATIYKPFIELAIEALHAHDGHLCKAIVRVLIDCKADKATIDKLVGRVFEQFCRKLEDAIDLLSERLKSIKGGRLAQYREMLGEYLNQVGPKVEVILCVGDLPGTSEERVRDAAASLLVNLAILAVNDTADYRFSIEVITLADKVVYSPVIRARLLESSRIINANQRQVDLNDRARERAERHEENRSALASALARNDYRTALAILDEMIALDPANAEAERERREQIASLLATQLYEMGIDQIRIGNDAGGRALLQEARSFENDPAARAKIQRALSPARVDGVQNSTTPPPARPNRLDDRESSHRQLRVAMARRDETQSLLIIERLLLHERGAAAIRLRALHNEITNFGIVSPVSYVPGLKTINGVGTTLYGDSICIVALFIPILWLGRYRVEALGGGRYSIQGKRRLGTWQVVYN